MTSPHITQKKFPPCQSFQSWFSEESHLSYKTAQWKRYTIRGPEVSPSSPHAHIHKNAFHVLYQFLEWFWQSIISFISMCPLGNNHQNLFYIFPQFHLNGANTTIWCTANGQNTHAVGVATNVSLESGNVIPKPMSRALKRKRATQAVGPVDFANQMRRKYSEMVCNNHPDLFHNARLSSVSPCITREFFFLHNKHIPIYFSKWPTGRRFPGNSVEGTQL